MTIGLGNMVVMTFDPKRRFCALWLASWTVGIVVLLASVQTAPTWSISYPGESGGTFLLRIRMVQLIVRYR